MNHILEAQQFDRPYLEKLFKSAEKLGKKPKPLLTGKILATLFYEPSTRTRLSFESAMHRLDGGVIATENANEVSSAVKGETIEDTAKIVSQYADVIVLRHFEKGAAARAAEASDVPIINAGDGAGQHPTQALLDTYTLQKEAGGIDGKTVALVGDLKNGRAARSFVYLLGKFEPKELVFVSPPELAMGEDIREYLTRHGIPFRDSESFEEAHAADAIYQTRIQKERFASPEEYERFKGKYILTSEYAASMKDKGIIMHPLPRVDEIDVAVDTSPHAVYFKQAKYGVHVRMALLADLLGR
ncbi:MAG: aspartate carbamoyltransferase [Patescibacteria group bacterium]|nr:aspartate carbamoyltransferase [Patescibacteria group bacterium]MDE1966081.1 aspartate carbamoyltransferase [Patescibacteria group bacterium]